MKCRIINHSDVFGKKGEEVKERELTGCIIYARVVKAPETLARNVCQPLD